MPRRAAPGSVCEHARRLELRSWELGETAQDAVVRVKLHLHVVPHGWQGDLPWLQKGMNWLPASAAGACPECGLLGTKEGQKAMKFMG